MLISKQFHHHQEQLLLTAKKAALGTDERLIDELMGSAVQL